MSNLKDKVGAAIEKLEAARDLLDEVQHPEREPEFPGKEPEVSSQTVRFTAREKAALQRLARHQRRSEHFIIKDILGPALLRAASELDAS